MSIKQENTQVRNQEKSVALLILFLAQHESDFPTSETKKKSRKTENKRNDAGET